MAIITPFMNFFALCATYINRAIYARIGGSNDSNRGGIVAAQNIVIFLSLIVMSVNACKTRTPIAASVRNEAASAREDLPILTAELIDGSMIQRISNWGRSDAEAMFGAKAYMHTIVFDDVVAAGRCQGILGARIVYANGDLERGSDRPYAMITLDPVDNGSGVCVYGSSGVVKSVADVKHLVAENRNLENKFDGFSAIKFKMSDALLKIRQKHAQFSSPTSMSLVSPAIPGMKDDPWFMIVGSSCGSRTLVYVNLSTGEILDGPKGVRGGC